MRYRAVVLTLFFLLTWTLHAKDPDSVLDRYIDEGLRNNLSLKQKYFDLEEAVEELRHARRMFFPSLSFQARYTWAAGGRQMTVPVGDLLSDIYTALNEVSGDGPYPTEFEDQSLPIVPEREHETKVSFIQPLLIPATIMNLQIQSRIRDLRELEIAAYRRILTAEMKKAYFNHLKAVSLVEIYEKSREVLEENLRDGDLIARVGGDEFVMVATDLDPAQTLEVAERLRTAVAKGRMPEGVRNVTISAGIGHAPADSGDDPVLLAERALTVAKQSGRNCVQLAD